MHPLLIVDPDPAARAQLAQQLASDFTVHGAETLDEAIQLIPRISPSIILVELDQRDGDGFTFIRQLRQHPMTHRVIIVCVTHRSSMRDKVKGFQEGADDFVVKPPSPTFSYRLRLLLRSSRSD